MPGLSRLLQGSRPPGIPGRMTFVHGADERQRPHRASHRRAHQTSVHHERNRQPAPRDELLNPGPRCRCGSPGTSQPPASMRERFASRPVAAWTTLSEAA